MLGPRPTVTVIVPMLNEERSVRALMDCLLRQSYPRDLVDIIVVDNGSQDATCEIVRSIADARVTLLHEHRAKNPDAARNLALSRARGDVLAFTDADCRPEPDWLAAAVAALETTGGDLAAGRIRFSFSPRRTVAELYDSVSFLQHDLSVARRRVAFTANLVVKRRVFDALGRFDVVEGWNGDSWFTKRATSSGFSLVYAAAAVVWHPARSLRPLLKKAVRIGSGQGKSTRFGDDQPSTGCGGLRRSLRTLTSKPHISHLAPWMLLRRLRATGSPLEAWRIPQVWLFGYVVVFVGAVAAATAYTKTGWTRRPEGRLS